MKFIKKLITTRVVTTKECHWLKKDIPAGSTVFKYSGVTYGIVGPNAIAVTEQLDKTPFFELPLNALEEVDESRQTACVWNPAAMGNAFGTSCNNLFEGKIGNLKNCPFCKGTIEANKI